MSPNLDNRNPLDDTTPRGRRFVFVQMLFALTIGEIARQTALLVGQAGFGESLSSYTHLVLVTVLVTTSWVGWTSSTAPGNKSPNSSVFSLSFIILLLDVALVIIYFIIAKGAEMPDSVTNKTVSTSANETFWILFVFIGYFLWDFLTKVVALPESTDSQKPNLWTRLLSGTFWKRAWITLFCCLLAFIDWLLLGNLTTLKSVIWTDISLLSIILVFRALKQKEPKVPIWVIISLLIAFIASLLFAKF